MHHDSAPWNDVRNALAGIDWKLQFDPLTLQRGRAYALRERASLTGLTHAEGGWSVEARVRGTQPYLTTVRVPAPASRLSLHGVCSCPMALNCKHVVAVLETLAAGQAAALPRKSAGSLPRTGLTAKDGLPLELSQWIEATAPPPSPCPGDSGLVTRYSFHAAPGSHPLRGAVARLAVLAFPATGLKLGRPVAVNLRGADRHPPAHFDATDLRLTREIASLGAFRDLSGASPGSGKPAELLPEGRFWGWIVSELLASGRAIWNGDAQAVLAAGPPRGVEPGWIDDGAGNHLTALRFTDTGNPAVWLATDPPGYLDSASRTIGPATWTSDVDAVRWLAAPAVPVSLVPNVVSRMADAGWNPELRPEPIPVIDLPEADLRPVPRLVLTRRAFGAASSPSDPYPFRRALPDALDYGDLPVALLQFRYGPVTLDNPVGDRTERVTIPGARVIHRFRRDLAEEAQRRHTLETLGFVPVSRFPGVPTSEARTSANAFAPWPESLTQSESEDLWYEFLAVLPQLKAAGWEVETDSAFDLVLTEADEWWTDLEEGSTSQWFRFDAGIEIGGRRLSLVEALREYALGLNGEEDWNVLCEAPEDAMVPLRLPGEDLVLAFPARRLGQLLACLYELFQAPGADGEFLHRLAAARIAGLLPELEGETIRALRALGKRLHDFQGIRKVKAPRSLKAELRPYQTDGLSWLQFLRAHDLGGVLADDMGLGKTVQTLAHLLTEKAAKRLDRPCLILAPSSLVGNWAAEAARFAPSLRVLSLQGPERKTRFEEIPDHDVVLSSYALLPRDEEALQAHDYHLVILDEAQYIKNPTSKVALAACSLRARHRLCLTGTPMENHLGELWSLFHFLMPGFLGAADVFRRQWRRPIEQDRSSEKRALLASRIAPLMLRRTRAQVLDELPPRTEILRTVPLDREQAELYEVVRAAMDRKVREAISAKGLARSQIIVLDALLKLRQICCHPSLLKLPTAKKAKRSAKLDLFRELITGLAEEKRRVLVFSQFTSMLEILERSLREESIPWVKLTGDTPSVDRAELVRQFQEGDVPVFLISLKAGGTGLNLTAADTVIHYDPWWNPAVEEQATGRAHRMGQKNPVMVYRLVTEGTIEERILDLQRRKAEIAGAILGDAEGSQEAGLAIEREDLERLLAPI